MARLITPKERINRRFGVAIFGPSKALEKRPYPPGQHGPKAGRRKQSDYALALNEKQKLRYQYGLMEKQMRRYVDEATRKRSITGETLLQFLELRLDSVCYRLGIAKTRQSARQMVNHGHITVNNKKVDIPSYRCKTDEVIGVRDKPSSQQLAMRGIDQSHGRPSPEWLSFDPERLEGTVNRIPSVDEINPIVNIQQIIEFYSR